MYLFLIFKKNDKFGPNSEDQITKNEKFTVRTSRINEIKRPNEDTHKPKVEITRYVGESLHLFCLNQRFGNIIWKKNGKVLKNIEVKGINRLTLKSYQITKLNELIIKSLRLRDTGSYECLFNGNTLVKILIKIRPRILKKVDFKADHYSYFSTFLIFVLSILTLLVTLAFIANILNEFIFQNQMSKIKYFENNQIDEIKLLIKINLQEYSKRFVVDVYDEQNVSID